MPDRHCKILYVLASPAWGGGEQYVYDLIASLQGRGYDCLAVTPPGGGNREKLLRVSPSGRVFRLPLRNMFDIFSAMRLARIIRTREIDLVHVNKFSDAFLAVWARRISGRKVRIVMTRHLVRKGKTGWLYTYLYRQLDRLIFVSELARSEFLSRGARIDPAKTLVIHNGIPDAPQSRSPKSDGTVTIAFAGRIAEEKGLHVLLDALSKYADKDFRLKIIGGGDENYTRELRRIAESGGIGEKVVFTGFTTDVNRELQEAGIGVLPSIVREGFGLSVLEYMRSGLAVVASADGGQAEFLTGGVDSLLVPNGDRDSLADALGVLLTESSKRREMGHAARRAFLQKLTYDRFLEKMTNTYRALCG